MNNTAESILNKLEEREIKEGKLPLLLEFYRELLKVQSGAMDRISVPSIGPESLSPRIHQGLPLIDCETMSLDCSLAEDIFARVKAVFAGYPQLFGIPVEKATEMSDEAALTVEAIKAWCTRGDIPETILSGLNENLRQAIFQAALHPFLASYAGMLSSYVQQEGWRRNYCPICGGSPDLSLLKGETGERWLVCSRCDFEWLYQRLQCAYCGNQDQRTLSFFMDDTEKYRLYVCEKCNCYIKTVDRRKTGVDTPPALERLYTLDLDNQAIAQGYQPGR
ncbi:MAG: formate dehydrogenase accessory protein FdhE [Dehalococcoidales bacterium]|nr:formate dehydrogenase accessory protein FdhE [Dehalococcoidales bacterium]